MSDSASLGTRASGKLVLSLRRLRANLGLLVFLAATTLITWLLVRSYPMPPANLDDAEHAAKVLAIFSGGLWVLYQFGLRRAFESALRMTLTVRSNALDSESHAVLVQIALANVGGRRIVCAPRLLPSQVREYEHSIRYPCDLQIRSVDKMKRSGAQVNWWLAQATEFPPASVLEEYSTQSGAIDFFMEPATPFGLRDSGTCK